MQHHTWSSSNLHTMYFMLALSMLLLIEYMGNIKTCRTDMSNRQ